MHCMCAAAGERNGSALVLGVSSFGAQGSNAHALLRSAAQPGVKNRVSGDVKLPWRRVSCWAVPVAQVCNHAMSACSTCPAATSYRPSFLSSHPVSEVD